ncbi:MAG: FecR domain-containing protein [Odoribacteraceae bacterium]|nr:FecR domain-containing protein [Odoribacteraceae bacterium]
MKENHEECIYRLSRGECTEEEKEMLSRWIEESDEHRRVYDDIRDIARAGELLQGRERLDKKRAWARVRRRTTGNAVLRRVARYAVSICIPFLLATGYFLLFPGGAPPAGNDESVSIAPGTTRATLYLSDGQRVDLQGFRGEQVVDLHAVREVALEKGTNTLNYHDPLLAGAPASVSRHKIIVPRGGEYPLTLPDGTRVWLNAETEIEFPLAFGKSREVRLSGEAFFEVKKENGRPFIIHARDASVEVTGTSFNLSCYPDDATITTAIESGSVSFITDRQVEHLTAGEQVTYNLGEQTLVVEEGVDLKYHSSWRHGQFYFYNTSLREITGKLGRWYDVRFEFADPSLEALRFSGAALRAKPIEFILELLERTRPLQFTVLQGRIIRVEPK